MQVHNPVHASLDAIVLILATCIRFPDHEQLPESLQVVKNGLQMLEQTGKFSFTYGQVSAFCFIQSLQSAQASSQNP